MFCYQDLHIWNKKQWCSSWLWKYPLNAQHSLECIITWTNNVDSFVPISLHQNASAYSMNKRWLSIIYISKTWKFCLTTSESYFFLSFLFSSPFSPSPSYSDSKLYRWISNRPHLFVSIKLNMHHALITGQWSVHHIMPSSSSYYYYRKMYKMCVCVCVFSIHWPFPL